MRDIVIGAQQVDRWKSVLVRAENVLSRSVVTLSSSVYTTSVSIKLCDRLRHFSPQCIRCKQIIVVQQTDKKSPTPWQMPHSYSSTIPEILFSSRLHTGILLSRSYNLPQHLAPSSSPGLRLRCTVPSYHQDCSLTESIICSRKSFWRSGKPASQH